METGTQTITCWGDGTPTRSFTYIDDAAEAIVAALDKDVGGDPINICDETEIAIRDLVEQIATLTGFTGDIYWDASKPNGQRRRLFTNTRAKEQLGWQPLTAFDTGLQRTIDWYRETRETQRSR